MNKMIRTRITQTLLALGLTLAVLPAAGQYATGRVTIRQTDFYRQGDQVTVGMDVELGQAEVSRRAYVLLRPVMKSEAANVEMELPSIMINGKNRARAYRRLVALKREPVYVGNVINAGEKNAPRSYRYSATVPYEDWMKRAVIGVNEEQCECNGPLVPMHFELLATNMENRNPDTRIPDKVYEMRFAASFLVPKPEAVKARSESGKAYLDFNVGRSELIPGFKNNADELAKIDAQLTTLQKDPYTTVTGIVIDGYASPEGTYAANMTLSGRRAVALKDYVRRTHNLPERLFRVQGRGEDWATLEELVAESNASWKEQALTIIRGTEIFDGREKKLMDLQGGAPYKQMLADLFPKLRRTDYEIKYSVIPFTVEEGKKALATNPSLLSLNELFLIAETYTPGSREYNEVFGKAAQAYPTSDVANVNAAAAALAHGDHQTALVYLGKIASPNAAALNDFGVAYAQRREFAKAREYFLRAQAEGNAEATANLAELNKMDE